MSEIRELKQRISELECNVSTLLDILNDQLASLQTKVDKQHFCKCGNNITHHNTVCATPGCPHGLDEEH